MTKENMEDKLRGLDEEAARLRRALEELENVVQSAPGSHSSGVPSPEVVSAERDIQGIVLRLSNLDRERQEVTVSMTLRR